MVIYMIDLPISDLLSTLGTTINELISIFTVQFLLPFISIIFELFILIFVTTPTGAFTVLFAVFTMGFLGIIHKSGKL